MISNEDLIKCRTPSELDEFVKKTIKCAKEDEKERRNGQLKKGNYKKIIDELVPLSIYARFAYTEDYKIKYVIGSQGYDAVVYDKDGKEVEKVEITAPQDGERDHKDIELVQKQGFGEIQVGDPGDDFPEICTMVKKVCRNKSIKDYSDSVLVVAINPMPFFIGYEDGFEKRKRGQIYFLVFSRLR